MLGRNLLIDVDGAVQRTGERRIFNDRDAVLGRDLTDFSGHQVGAFGDTNRRAHAPLVL